MQHHAKHIAQIGAGEIFYVVPIHTDGATIDIIEAHQQFDQGGLACAGRADDGNFLTGGNGCREVFDDDFFGVVAKADMLKLHPARDGRQFDRISGFGNFFGLFEEGKDTFGRGSGLLQDIGDIGKLRDRLGK